MDKNLNHNDHKHSNHHHILSTRMAVGIGCTLIFLTAVTVWVAGIDLGAMNFIVAMLIATTKGLLVALFFMGLYYDRRENGIIFATSFLFLTIFFVLTSTDLFFRGDVYVKGPIQVAEAKSKLVKPWISTPALIAHGKELFAVNCTSCHGDQGLGNGPAASALNPHPRNFHQDKDWVNGRKPSQVFGTIKNGVAGSAMASFSTLPSDDRWALVHFVLSLGPTPPADTAADLAKIGIDPNKEGSSEVADVTIPVEAAMKMMAQPAAPKTSGETDEQYRTAMMASGNESPGSQIFKQNCVQCHGDRGQGGIRVPGLPNISSPASISTDAFHPGSEWLGSEESFAKHLDQGIAGGVMPDFANLSGAEMSELYQYVKSLAH
jgi:caa(3)-type oxidase subunit IV